MGATPALFAGVQGLRTGLAAEEMAVEVPRLRKVVNLLFVS
jgi:hypothetical protein